MCKFKPLDEHLEDIFVGKTLISYEIYDYSLKTYVEVQCNKKLKYTKFSGHENEKIEFKFIDNASLIIRICDKFSFN